MIPMISSQTRIAWRMLRRNPVTSSLAVVALALGIGMTTSMFSLVYGVLLYPVPFEDSHRLMDVATYDLDEGWVNQQSPPVSVHDFLDWRQQQTSFESLAAANLRDMNLNDEDGFPERYSGGQVSWNAFRTLGVAPVVGRDFKAEDAASGATPVTILGHDVWRNRFASDPAVVGREIRVNGEVTTVIGVMPRDFAYPVFEDLWVPMNLDVAEIRRGEAFSVYVIGRLREGISRAEAQAEFSTIAARLAETWPETNAGRGAWVQDYRQSLNNRGNVTILGAMFAAVCLVLVIACANVASLLLARASLRAKELALRTALGAERRRVISILVGESLLLSLLGSTLGLGLAYLMSRFFEDSLSWQALPFWISLAPQPAAAVFVIAAGGAAGLLAGLLPAWKASGAVSFDLLKDEARGSSGLRIGRISRGLVIAELALACALLVSTSLMIRTVRNYHAIDPGFATDSILTASVTLPSSGYPQGADREAFYERLLDDLSRRPEVTSAAAMTRAPGTYMGSSAYALEGRTYANQSEVPRSPRGIVSPDFFETYSIPLVEGRLFTRLDDADSERVVIVNESFVEENWPGESPLGRRMRLGTGGEEPWRSVVGVVPDAGVALLQPGFAGTTAAGFYIPYAQAPAATMTLAVKTRGEPAAFAAGLRESVARLDAGLAVDQVKTMERIYWETTFSVKLITLSFGFFGGVALLLAAVGIFGVMMFAVEQRTQEIGVRMALGAGPGEVLGLIMRQGLGRLIVGLGLGLVLATGLASTMRMALYGVEPSDPWSYAGTIAVLSAVALVACFIPAWRAARVDPLDALHHE